MTHFGTITSHAHLHIIVFSHIKDKKTFLYMVSNRIKYYHCNKLTGLVIIMANFEELYLISCPVLQYNDCAESLTLSKLIITENTNSLGKKVVANFCFLVFYTI